VGCSAEVAAAVQTVRTMRTLRPLRLGDAPVEIVPATEVIDFGEKITSIRSKRDSSIHVGARLVRDGRACAFVSAGHTGAVMAISKVVYGLIDGVDRPALPAPLPRPGRGYTVLVDAGANLDCRPEHLQQFAVMGYHYSRRVLGVPNPRVALLSIGEEDTKGNEIGREVARILRETPINFIGNVEGHDLFGDKADVVVCDGFVGNVALKVAEGLAESLGGLVKLEFRRTPWRRLGAALLLWPALRPIRKKADYAEVGGVPLLGLKKVSVVAHGRSTPKAIKNALRVAQAAVSGGMLEMIAGEIAALHDTEQRLAERSTR
jgi:glycerol-3-phosphate acyltransferase PlsX